MNPAGRKLNAVIAMLANKGWWPDDTLESEVSGLLAQGSEDLALLNTSQEPEASFSLLIPKSLDSILRESSRKGWNFV